MVLYIVWPRVKNRESVVNHFICSLHMLFTAFSLVFHHPLVQQSVAFKILRTRLKTVPPYSFSGEQFKRQSPGNAFTEANHVGGSQIIEDGDVGADPKSVQNGINFASWLKQFERVQEQHRAHSRTHSLNRCNSASSKVCHTLLSFPSFRKYLLHKLNLLLVIFFRVRNEK